jgi:tetratricopeptide (TPR) repeat protein
VLEQRYKAAQNFQAANQLDKAAQQYRIFIADTLGQIALGHARAGQPDKALNEFDEALTLVPEFPALQLEYARVALEDGNLEHAEVLAAGVLRAHSGDAKLAAKAHSLLGRVLLKKGKNAEAKAQIEQAVALDPTFEYGYALAIADLDLGDGDGAAKIFSEMLASFGDTAAIHMLFGQAYGGSDFQAKALEEFKAAIAKDNRLPGAHYSLASAYLATSGNARLHEVEAELRKEIEVSPASAAAYGALGHLLAGQHADTAMTAEALHDLKRAAELDPKNPDAFLYLGQFYADAKMVPEAEAALRRSIVLTNDVSRNGFQVQKAHYVLGRLLIQTGRTDEGKQEIVTSQTLLQRNLSRDQDRLADYLGNNRSGSAQDAALDGETTAANEQNAEQSALTEQFEKQFGPALADSYNNLGAIAGSQNNYPLALRYFERAEEWNPALPGLDYNWGRAAFAAGTPAEAVGPLARYLHEHPEDDGARTVLGLSQFLSKDYAGTRKTLDPIADKSGEPVQAQFAYAKALIETNDLDSGRARLLALEKTNPNISDVHRALGEAYAEHSATKASEEFETAIRLNPSDVEAYTALGHLQLAHGNAKAALTNLEAASKLQPNDAELRQQLEECKRKATHE